MKKVKSVTASTPTNQRILVRSYLRNLEFEKEAAKRSTPLQDTKNKSNLDLNGLKNLPNLLE